MVADDRTEDRRQHAGWWRDVLTLTVILVVFVVVFVVLRETPRIHDPIEYFAAANRLGEIGTHHRQLRIGLLFPVALAQWVFGYSQAAYYAFPLVVGVTLIVSTFVTTRLLFGLPHAAVASVLVWANGFVLGSLHQMWPDLPATAVFACAVAVLVVMSRLAAGEHASGAAVAGLALAVGLLLGWAYLIREFTVVLFPIVPVAVWLLRIPLRQLVPIGGGALAVLGFELVYNDLQHGDAIVRIREVLRARNEAPPAFVSDLNASRARSRGSPLERVAVLPRMIKESPAGTAFVALVALGAAAFTERRRSRLVLIVWFGAYWLTITLMSLSVDSYGRSLNTSFSRYWLPAIPPLVMLGAGGAVELVRRLVSLARASRAVAVTVAVAVAVSPAVLVLLPSLQATTDVDHEYEDLRAWLAGDDPASYDRLWTTQRSDWKLRMFTSTVLGEQVWDGRIRTANGARRFRAVEDLGDEGMFVLSDEFFEPRFSNWRDVTPDYLLDPPDDWSLLAMTEGSSLAVFDISGDGGSDGDPVAQLAGWRVRPVAGETVPAAADVGDGTTVSVPPAERVRLARPLDASDLSPGDVLRIDVEVEADGRGNVVLDCFVRDGRGGGRRIDGLSLWGVGVADGVDSAETICALPASMDQAASVDLIVELSGPIDVSVGDVDVRVIRDAVLPSR